MQQVIVELDEKTIAELNRFAPARARKRSEFIRAAIRAALNQRLDEEMERAYRKQPPEATEPDLDPATWEASAKKQRRAR